MGKQVVLIVGASSTIGRQLIRDLPQENTIVLAHFCNNEEALESLKQEVELDMLNVQADLSTKAGVNELVLTIDELNVLPTKIVFLAAPKLKLIRFKNLTWQDFQRQSEMQVYVAYRILNAYLPKLAKLKEGRVVFMLSSATSGVPPMAMAHYVTAKYALLGLMKSLSSEYSSKGITVNAVSPSMIETEFLSQIPQQLVEITADKHPLGRNGLPADVVPAICFLLSQQASFITGVNLPITGGA